jgi:glucokinase
MTTSGNHAALGIDLGGTRIKWAVSDGMRVLEGGEDPTPRTGAADVVAALRALIEDRGGIATGLALPGPAPQPGERLFLPNVPGDWDAIDLAGELEAASSRLVLLNDAIAFAHGELQGAARGHRDVAFFTLGTGVGGAIAIDGRVVTGVTGRAGELGHVTVDPGGALCVCGNRGCLETLASASAIVAAASRYVVSGTSTVLREACHDDPSRLTTALVAEAAAGGDPHAADVLSRAGRGLGIAIANVCAVVAPELVVVGGGVASALERMRPGVDEVLSLREAYMPAPPIVGAALGEAAGPIGAAAAAIGG